MASHRVQIQIKHIQELAFVSMMTGIVVCCLELQLGSGYEKFAMLQLKVVSREMDRDEDRMLDFVV